MYIPGPTTLIEPVLAVRIFVHRFPLHQRGRGHHEEHGAGSISFILPATICRSDIYVTFGYEVSMKIPDKACKRSG
jgi:hypothetical protein